MAVNRAFEFLDELERAEARALRWGLSDTFFSEAELEERADAFVRTVAEDGNEGTSGWDLVEELLDTRLLWKIPGTQRYRTRMAEAVRLFARLRQIFPDQRGEGWRTAPGLVADYRFIVRSRLFPNRDVGHRDALDAIREARRLTPLQERVVSALLGTESGREVKLARFQVRAAQRVLRSTPGDRASGTLVSAGTGSGKTLAFYLPAYALVAESISSEYWTKCIALYPRNELLKDQLREALANARRIRNALTHSGKRALVLGALYGGVPNSPRNIVEEGGPGAWRRTSLGRGVAYLCPFARCPLCGGETAWTASDISASTERLTCTNLSCGGHIEPDEIRLTRERMLSAPPDVLFTSTEMLNQRLSASRFAPLLGIGVRSEHRVPLLLLDEVHSYEGVHGAQVALLLRRWRRAADARPHMVGLSATLADGPRFFGDLVGLGQGDIAEVAPEAPDMMGRGAEYLLALRGDPTSGTSLLSTTIQAAMLMRRLLATEDREPAGRKVFAFTDNLDVINRLYHSVLDAEGWDSWGRPNARRPQGSLANLRGSTLPHARERFQQGQNWEVCEAIGHVLAPGQRVRVGRTSSQDTGVDPLADIVVATAALEVGFDDPEVGAVLQHKAPHSTAAFLQRKGRAGRRQDMRPWTVVVLSDYGRDRVSYQGYDQLFSPSLPPRHLPLKNRAVLRMQAALAFCDWLARRSPVGQGTDPWSDLAQPPSAVENAEVAGLIAARQRLYAQSLRALLEQGSVRDELAVFLARALGVTEAEASALLWEPPRAIVTEVAPTLLRRLERGWRRAGATDQEPHTWRHPLPEFIPRTLFSDLHVPEVEIRLPAIGRQAARLETMPVAQALQEFAPGRVSKRFGVSRAGERHWVSPGDGGQLSIDTFCPADDRQILGHFHFLNAQGGSDTVEVFRPFALTLELTPQDVQQSSNSFLEWHAEILPTSQGHNLDQPERSTRWSEVLKLLRVHAHHLGGPVEFRRFSLGARASVGRGRQQRTTLDIAFVSQSGDGGDRPAALGFVADVDAIEVVFEYPRELYKLCESDPVLLRALRTSRFRDRVRTAPELDGVANVFQRDWLSQAYSSALTKEALRRHVSLAAAAEAIGTIGTEAAITDVLPTILQWSDDPDEGPDDDSGGGGGGERRPRRLEELLRLIRLPAVTTALSVAATDLVTPPDDGWEDWLRSRFKATLAAAILDAAQSLCPRMSEDALVVDLNAVTTGPAVHQLAAGTDRFWLSETTIGGGGFVEEFLRLYGDDPRRFFRFVDAALGESDLEAASGDLARVVRMAVPGHAEDRAVSEAFGAVRSASSYSQSVDATAQLRTALSRQGILTGQTLLVAINARLLSAGSSEATDRLVADLLAQWSASEQRLGIDIDSRVFALHESGDEGLERALAVPPPGDTDAARAIWRFGVLCGLLWPRGGQLRVQNLRLPTPFEPGQECDRLLLQAVVPPSVHQVSVDEVDWFARLSALLLREGTVELVSDEAGRLAEALLRIGLEPVDSEALLVHARVAGIGRDGTRLRATIELPEAIQ